MVLFVRVLHWVTSCQPFPRSTRIGRLRFFSWPYCRRQVSRQNVREVSITTPSGEVKTQECLVGADIVVQAMATQQDRSCQLFTLFAFFAVHTCLYKLFTPHIWKGPHGAVLRNTEADRARFTSANQVGDEVTKDEPLTTNPNVGGFGQAGCRFVGLLALLAWLVCLFALLAWFISWLVGLFALLAWFISWLVGWLVCCLACLVHQLACWFVCLACLVHQLVCWFVCFACLVHQLVCRLVCLACSVHQLVCRLVCLACSVHQLVCWFVFHELVCRLVCLPCLVDQLVWLAWFISWFVCLACLID